MVMCGEFDVMLLSCRVDIGPETARFDGQNEQPLSTDFME